MKTWIKRSLFAVLGVTVLVGGMAACAGRGHGPGGWHGEKDPAAMRERVVERVGRKLDLDDAQKQRLGVLADALQKQRTALVAPGSDPREDLRGLVSGGTFDRAGAQALLNAKLAAVQANSPEVIVAMADFYDGLRPEQQQTVRGYMDKRRHR